MRRKTTTEARARDDHEDRNRLALVVGVGEDDCIPECETTPYGPRHSLFCTYYRPTELGYAPGQAPIYERTP